MSHRHRLHILPYSSSCSTVSDSAPIHHHPGILCDLSSGRFNLSQSIFTFFKAIIFAYSIGTCQNNMSHLKEKEIEYKLESSKEGSDEVASGCAIGKDSEKKKGPSDRY